ncbi:TonB-dependent receptor [uncultured Capnocytophaga sp.]|uniref:TonB-dependent receptor n=1 Tax=uncultured Capnocytophaga sp. TaxID=159273 RepID=UPI002614D355|nr:TonB-dependent receptor plug domain-containing protein [uncultured Capnocytophaga sp.]
MKAIITLLLLITTYALSAQKTVDKIVSREQNSPLLVVNGVLIDDDKAASIFLSAINTNDIESINVLKSATTLPTLCSNRAENGVVIITLKKKDISKKADLSGIEAPKEVFPLVVVNDVEFSDPEVGKLLIDNINLEKVDRVVVLKDKKATKKYGEKAKKGVLLITLKGKTEKLDISLIEKTP